MDLGGKEGLLPAARGCFELLAGGDWAREAWARLPGRPGGGWGGALLAATVPCLSELSWRCPRLSRDFPRGSRVAAEIH